MPPRLTATAGSAARRLFIGLACSAACLLTAPAPAAETSELAPLAAKALLLGVARAGDRFIAVGDHGNIVVSADNGQTWTQSLAPTRALLTAVSFPDAQHGWAVGHEGVILATADAGKTWTRQDDGKDLDSIFLDVLFLDAQRGFTVGAYGKFMATQDGGKTWTAGHPGAEEAHYNTISAGPNGWLYLAGESGTLLTSPDSGVSWTRAEVPYDGSLFAAIPLDQRTVVVAGLRGHILTSPDNGASWEPRDSDVKVLIMAGLRLANGTVVLGGQGGNFFISRNSGHTFTPWKPAEFGSSVAALAETSDGWLLSVGEAGAVRLRLP
ncbi:MAG: hypothetical protein HYV95_01555 [Opitutae bacterium]|nr:hypothetical protein [Opitutae bacterium]